MSNNYLDFPTGIPFVSALLTEVLGGHHKGHFKWMMNERNSRMRVLHYEKSKGVWETDSWLRNSKQYDRELKKIFK